MKGSAPMTTVRSSKCCPRSSLYRCREDLCLADVVRVAEDVGRDGDEESEEDDERGGRRGREEHPHGADLGAILVEGRVAEPVQAILDAPVSPDPTPAARKRGQPSTGSSSREVAATRLIELVPTLACRNPMIAGMSSG